MELDRCLASVRCQDFDDFEVLVVDSASLGAEARDIAQRWGARYIREPLPGVSRARNRGVGASQAPLIAMIDDEAVADPSWLTQLLREFADPQVMAVAGRIKAFEPSTDEERICAVLGGADGGLERQVLDRSCPQWFERACFGGVGCGANLAFRREAFAVWPGFCESLGAGARIVGGEEHYAFFGVVERGYSVVYSPTAVVSHPVPTSMQALQQRHLRYLSASVGYIALLFAQQPLYRRKVATYLVEALRGTPRTWRSGGAAPRVRLAPRWKSALAVLSGLRSFLLDRLDRSAPPLKPGGARPAVSPAASSNADPHEPVDRRRSDVATIKGA